MHVPSIPMMMMMILLAPFVLWLLLFILSEYGGVSLKPLKPWLTVLLWLSWGLGLIGLVSNRRWNVAFVAAYSGISLVLGWLNRRYLFVNTVKPARSLASVLTVQQPTYVAVRNVSTASPWYVEKFGLRELPPSKEIRSDAVSLKFKQGTHPIILVARDKAISRSVPVFFTRNIAQAQSRLTADGISTGPIQEDRQGTKFFELLDGEGNTLEVCEVH